MITDSSKGKMDAVGQACAVDKDIGPLFLRGKDLRVFFEEVPIDTLIPYVAQHIADSLAVEIGIRIEDPHIVAIPPVMGMTIGEVAQDIVLGHGPDRIGIPIAKGPDRRLKAILTDEGIKEVGVSKVKDEPFLSILPEYLGDIGRVDLAICVGLNIISEDSP